MSVEKVLSEIKSLNERQTRTEELIKSLGGRPGTAPEVVAGKLNRSVKETLYKTIGWGEYLKDLISVASNQHSSHAQETMAKHGSVLATKALAGGTGTAGGYTIPQQFADKLMLLAAEASIFAQMATNLPMEGRSLLVPCLDQSKAPPTDGSAYFGGVALAWTEEAGDTTATEPSFNQLEMTAHELTGYTEVANSLLQDSAAALDSLLTTLLSSALAWAKDHSMLNGNGRGKPLGVINAPGTVVVTRTTSNRFKLSDSANMLSRLPGSCMETAVWVMSQSLIPEMVQLADSGNNVVWIPNFAVKDASQGGGAAVKMPAMLHGRPIFWTEKAPTLGSKGDVSLVDWSQYLLGTRQELALDVSPHAKFRNNQTAWRIVARFDGQPWVRSPITLADGTTTVSPYVTLAA